MRTIKEICDELNDFVLQHDIGSITYETKLIEAIFELLLDIRDLENRR